MSIMGSRTKLSAVTKDLSANWQHTKDSWKDAKSQEFEKKYIEPLLSSVNTAVTVMEKLDMLMAKVKSDCE